MSFSCRNVVNGALLVCLIATSTWCSPQAVHGSDNSSLPLPQSTTSTSSTTADHQETTSPVTPPFRVIFMKSLWSDQKAIWSSPFHLRAHDSAWLLPIGLATGALVAADSAVMQQVSESPDRVRLSRDFGNYGAVAMLGTAGGLLAWGGFSKNAHSSETGLLAGEALVNGTIVAESLKLATQRARPDDATGRGFGQGGNSFPSEHAIAAWSVAAVIANEYPGPLTKFLVYGAASAVSLSRITGREHFPSDVAVGSTLGWLIGRQVYRAHHDRDLGGASWGTIVREKPQFLRAPAEFGSPYVPLDSWIYASFDRLAALGYAPSAFANLRPWTRMDCARLIESAGQLVEGDNPQTNALALYTALKVEFASELARIKGSNTSEVRVESVYSRYTGIAGTPLADGYHFGQTLINDFGRPYGEGANVVTGASARASAGPVAFYIRAEYQHAASLTAYSPSVQQLIGQVDDTPAQLPIHTNAIDQVRLLEAYAAWNFKSVQLSVGRQSLDWGPARGGSLMYSNNVEPMDMVRLTKTSPWKLPSFLGLLGPMRWDAFFGLMAGHHFPADPAVHGQKISFKPTPNLEFGFSRTVVFKPVTAGRFWKSFVSVGDTANLPGSQQDVGDRRGGFDFSYRVPGLRNWLMLYNDSLTDDDPSPLAAPHRSMMNPGIYLPQIPKVPKLDLRVEAPFSDTPAVVDRGGRFFYWNSAFHDSYTNGGNLLGSWVGREGHGLQIQSSYWFSPRNTLQLSYREASVDKEFIPSGGHIRDFSVRATFLLASGVDLATFVQHERWNFPVLSSRDRSDTSASVQVTFRPK